VIFRIDNLKDKSPSKIQSEEKNEEKPDQNVNLKLKNIKKIKSKNGKAKPYQIKQIRNIIIKYKLGDNLDV